LARVARRQQQPEIRIRSELVEIDDPRAEVRTLRGVVVFERRRPRRCLLELALHVRDVGVDLFQLLGIELPFDFELPEIAEDSALFARQAISFALQRLQPLRRTPRECLRACAIGLLSKASINTKDTKGTKGTQKELSQAIQKIGFPSMSLGIVTPKYFRTVGAMSMICVTAPADTEWLEIRTPGVAL
jgi:hypothetical protein